MWMKKGIFYGIVLLAGLILNFGLVCSCSDVEDRGVAMGREAMVAVSFRVNPERVIGGAQGASSGGGCVDGPQSRSVLNPGTDTDEGTAPGYVPRDVWMMQYDGVGDDAPLLGLPRYVELSGTVNLQAVVSSFENTLVFVANTHDANLEWGDIGTLSKLKLSCKVISRQSHCYGNNLDLSNDLMMSGKYEGVVTSGAISVELFRDIVRLDFTLKNGLASGMSVKSVQLCSVPRNLYYTGGIMASGLLFPVASAFFDYPPEAVTSAAEPGGMERFTFYMPANERGVVTASISGKTKPIHAPSHSSYIRIVALDANNRAYVYKIYPGANLVDDYNMSANHRYSVDISINAPGDALNDGRVDYYGRTDFPVANSYILNPAPEGAADRVFTIPLDRVNQFWSATDPTLTLGPADDWTVDIIWQDTPTPDLIRFLGPGNQIQLTLDGRGPDQRIVLTTKSSYQGNALIGLKKKGRQEVGYLWSWHLWVTDYDPRHTAAPVAGQYLYSVPGGYVHRYSGSSFWSTTIYSQKYIMDRNLGARSPDYTTLGVLYYQFGRKDPMPINEPLNPLRDGSGVLLTSQDPRNAAKMNKDAGYGVTIATSVLNPSFFYYRTAAKGGGDWCGQGLWGNYVWNNPVEGRYLKSIYDPCPPGWQLPIVGALNGFVYNAANPALSTVLDTRVDRALGWSYEAFNGVRYWPVNSEVAGSIYYPALGARMMDSGGMASMTGMALYWFGDAANSRGGFDLNATASRIYVSGNDTRAYGFSARCVQE